MNKQDNFDKQDNFKFMISTIKSLACSQGFYGRLYRDIQDLESNDLDDLIKDLKKQYDEILKLDIDCQGEY